VLLLEDGNTASLRNLIDITHLQNTGSILTSWYQTVVTHHLKHIKVLPSLINTRPYINMEVARLHRPTMVSLFEVFCVLFINFRTLSSKIMPDLSITYSFLTKLNFYFHERDSREPKLNFASIVVNNVCMYSFFTIFTHIFHFTY
jgi:hypothetical protein